MWVCCVLVLMSYRKDSKTVLVSISVHMVGKVPQMTTAASMSLGSAPVAPCLSERLFKISR